MRESEPHPSALDEILRHWNAIFFHQRFAGFESHRPVKGASHRAAYQQPIDFRKQLLDNVNLTRDLCTAQDCNERALRIGKRATQILELCLHQQAGDCGPQMLGDADSGGVCSVRSAKGIVHKKVAQLRQGTREARIIFLFAAEEARVLEQKYLPGLEIAAGLNCFIGVRGLDEDDFTAR